MTSHDDINGVSRCCPKKTNIDLTDKQLFVELERNFPGAGQWMIAQRGGEPVHVPSALYRPWEMAAMVDDGEMSIRELARMAGVSRPAASRARKSRVSPG